MNRIPSSKYVRLVAAFDAGLSIRASASHAGVANNTACLYFHRRPPMICPCGKSLPHKGMCGYRIALYPKRQAFLKSKFAVSDQTITHWDFMRNEILYELQKKKFIWHINDDGMKELERFYKPQDVFWGTDERGEKSIVAVSSDEENNFDLYTAISGMEDKVKKLLMAIVEGLSLDSALRDADMSELEFRRHLPSLKVFLKPYLYS